jgi:phosphatidylglycerol:prolipoprotein diacylglycerol transferase
MHPVLITLGPVTIYTFGLFAVLSLFISSFFVWKRGREGHYLDEDIFDAIVFVGLVGIIGARAAYIFENFNRFGFSLFKWLSIFRISGLKLYGAVLFGFYALWLISKRKRWEFFSISDIAVTGFSIGQAIGWLGAFFSGFGVGRVTSFLGLKFVGHDNPRFPLQIIWIVGMSLLFVFLWKVEDRYRTLSA